MTVKRPAPGDLEPIERASADELQALQLTRLQRTLQHAYDNVPHYRKAFDAKGVHPSDCRSLTDLAKFPFTVKSDLRDNYPFGMFAVPREQVVRVHASSGTTGKPTVVGYTQGDIDRWADLVGRSIRAGGGRPGDMVHVAYGYGLFTGGLGAHYGAEKMGCTVVPMSGGQTEKQVQLIVDFKPDIIMVTPSYMQVIIEEFRRQGLDPREMSVKVGIFGAEPWTEEMRRDIERSADIDAVDIDEAAVTSTELNALANGVRLQAGLPDKAQGQYQTVLANILATPLKVLAPLLCSYVAPGGHLVLAGILERQAEELQAAYAPWVTLEVADAQEGWILMTAKLSAQPA